MTQTKKSVVISQYSRASSHKTRKKHPKKIKKISSFRTARYQGLQLKYT